MSTQSTAIVPASGWFSQAWASVGRALGLTNPITATSEPPPDPAFAGVPYVPPDYSPKHALSAMRANPWVLSCVKAIADDLSGIPLRAYPRGQGRKSAQPVETSLFVGTQWRMDRRQVYVDYVMTSRAHMLILRRGTTGNGPPIGLRRRHPVTIMPITDNAGSLIGWQEDGTNRQWNAKDIISVMGFGWQEGAESWLPQSIVQTLEPDIKADIAIAQHAAISASKGRPDATISPPDEKTQWDARALPKINETVRQAFNNNHGGVAVFGQTMKLDVLGWAPKDMEGEKARTWTRQSIMACFGVPPARLSLDSLNRATQDDQMTTYWERLQTIARDFDAALNDSVGIELGLEFEHDFSGVTYLQLAQTKRLERVKMHVEIGMSVKAAYEMEGIETPEGAFEAPPVAQPQPIGEPLPDDTGDEEDNAGEEDDSPDLAELLAEAASLLGGDPTPENIAAALSILQDAQDVADNT